MITETQLITPRRNFLIRALGFTAAGATVAVPITTLADAQARVDHHCRELEKALRDRYGADVIAPPHLHLPKPARSGSIRAKVVRTSTGRSSRSIAMAAGSTDLVDRRPDKTRR